VASPRKESSGFATQVLRTQMPSAFKRLRHAKSQVASPPSATHANACGMHTASPRNSKCLRHAKMLYYIFAFSINFSFPFKEKMADEGGRIGSNQVMLYHKIHILATIHLTS